MSKSLRSTTPAHTMTHTIYKIEGNQLSNFVAPVVVPLDEGNELFCGSFQHLIQSKLDCIGIKEAKGNDYCTEHD